MSLLEKIKDLFDDREATVRANLSNKEVETAKEKLISEMFVGRTKFDPAFLQWFSNVETIDLGTAHTNTQIWDRGGRGFFVVKFDGTSSATTIRFNDKSSSKYPIYASGYIKGAFNKIYLTNTAQAGKTLKFVIGYRNFADFQMLEQTVLDTIAGLDFAEQTTLALINTAIGNLPTKATTPLLANVSMTNGNTEYDYTFPDNTKKFCLSIHLGTYAYRVAWVTGKVATPTQPYVAMEAGKPYERWGLNLTGKTIYFACSEPTREMMIETYT